MKQLEEMTFDNLLEQIYAACLGGDHEYTKVLNAEVKKRYTAAVQAKEQFENTCTSYPFDLATFESGGRVMKVQFTGFTDVEKNLLFSWLHAVRTIHNRMLDPRKTGLGFYAITAFSTTEGLKEMMYVEIEQSKELMQMMLDRIRSGYPLPARLTTVINGQLMRILPSEQPASTSLEIKGVQKIATESGEGFDSTGTVEPAPDARIVRVGNWTKFEEVTIEQIVSAIFQAGQDINGYLADALQKELEHRIAGDDAVFTPPNPMKVVLCTEDGVDAYDWRTGETVKKYLVIDGMTLYHPEGTAVTLGTDSPGAMISELAGMVYDIEATERDDMPGQPELEGIMKFSGGSAGEKGWGYYKKDPQSRFSVGYREDESVYVPEGKSYEIPERTFVDRASASSRFNGRTFVGPCIVVTRWTLLQILLLPTA